MKVLPGPTKSNQVLVWSPDGRLVAAGGNGDGVMVWDVAAGTPGQRVLASGHSGRVLRFCPRTSRLYVAFQTGGFWSWNPASGEERLLLGGYSIAFGLAVSADGRTIALHNYGDDKRRRELTQRVTGYAVSESGELTEAWTRTGDKWDERGSIALRPGTDQLFGLGTHTDGKPRFEWLRPEVGEVAGSFVVATSRGYGTRWALSPDGERVAWATEHGLFLRRLDDDPTLELPATGGEILRGLAFHPSGRTLAYATGTTVHLLDADTFAEVRAFDWGTGKVRAIAFSPDGLRAAISGEGGKGWVTVFDLE